MLTACANKGKESQKSTQQTHSQVNDKQSNQNAISSEPVAKTDVSQEGNLSKKKQIIKSSTSSDNIKIKTAQKSNVTSSHTSTATKANTAVQADDQINVQKGNSASSNSRSTQSSRKEQSTTAVNPDKPTEVNTAKSVTTDTEPTQSEKSGRRAQSRPMHKYFDYILKNSVNTEGGVDYKGIKADVKRLDKYLADLQSFPPQSDWSKAEKLAYWINAYNAYTIKLIIDNYPVSSITDLYGGKPWDHKWIELDGQMLSLNAIENEIIRPRFKEPRIHFAVNCAAKSCPPLANTAYTKDNLETLLDQYTTAFINNSKYNKLSNKPAEVSKIFDWYAEDFGDVATFINKYLASRQPPIENIVYMTYDWSLNNDTSL